MASEKICIKKHLYGRTAINEVNAHVSSDAQLLLFLWSMIFVELWYNLSLTCWSYALQKSDQEHSLI